MTEKRQKPTRIIRFAVLFEAGICLLAWCLGWLLEIPLFRQMDATWTSVTVGILATGPLVLAMWWCSTSKLTPLRALMREVDDSLVPLFSGSPTQTLLLISLLAGIGEEWLFRGIIQTGLAGWLGLPTALLVTSALFGIAHLVTPTYAVLAGLIGFYLGMLAVVTGSLLTPILAHAIYDYAALTYLISPSRKRTA